MIVVDSSVLISALRRETTDLTSTLRSVDVDEILIGGIVLLAALRGARDDRHARRAKEN